MTLAQAIEFVESTGFKVDEFLGKYAIRYSDNKVFLPYMSEAALINFAILGSATANWK